MLKDIWLVVALLVFMAFFMAIMGARPMEPGSAGGGNDYEAVQFADEWADAP
jgi:hypothetical protein